MTDKQYEVLRNLGERIEQHLTDDRAPIDKMVILMETIKSQNDRILSGMTRTQSKVSEAISDAVQEVVTPIAEQMDEFTDKKVIPLKEKQVENIGFIRKFWKTVRGWR